MSVRYMNMSCIINEYQLKPLVLGTAGLLARRYKDVLLTIQNYVILRAKLVSFTIQNRIILRAKLVSFTAGVDLK